MGKHRYREVDSFMVMSATTITNKSANVDRCFETNAINILTRREAERIADFRNATEDEAGHRNVEWYVIPMYDWE